MECDDRAAARLSRRSFLGELDPAALVELHRHLASCPSCRANYDRQVAIERSLEPGAGPLPAAHLELLGKVVVARTRPAPARTAPWWRWALPVPLAAAIALGVWVARPGEDGFQARAGEIGPAEGLRAFCIGRDGGEPRILASVLLGEGVPLRCPIAESLQFSYTTGDASRHLAVVSVPDEAEGSPLVYMADDSTLAVAARATDEPLPYSTRLAARHVAGKRTLYALFFIEPRTTAEIEATARALGRGGGPPPGLGVFLRSMLIVD